MAPTENDDIPPARVWIPEEDQRYFAEHVTQILSSGRLTLGSYTENFETEFASHFSSYTAIALNSGTAALEVAIRALRPEKSTFLVPTNTFYATPAAVVHAGLRVRFLDMEETSLSVDPDDLSEKINPDVAGVIVVHIGGIVSPRLKEIREYCDDYSIVLIEDCAHAHGSTIGSSLAGSFGDASAFSFFPTKVITCGEGGMLLLRGSKAIERARILRDQGKASGSRNLHVDWGYNWRLSEIHALLGLTQLRRLSEFTESRRKLARRYDKELPAMPGLLPFPIPPDVESNYYKYICLLEEGQDRARVKRDLSEKHRVRLSGEVYDTPCHLQPIFRDLLHHSQGDFPVAESFCNNHVCLPLYSNMTDNEQQQVLSALAGVLQ